MWALAAAVLAPAAARADVQVAGSAATVRLEARHAPLADVLAAFAHLDVRVRAHVALDRVVDGSYRGELGRVLSRLLEGYDFVVVRREGGADVLVIGPAGAPLAKTRVAAQKADER